MDSQRRVFDGIVTKIVYNCTDDEFLDGLSDQDPEAFFRKLGMGLPGAPPLPRSFPSAQEVRAEALILSEKVFNHWSRLSIILKIWEGTIQKRWLGKTKEKRKKVLLHAWPEMPSMHRPDFDAFRSTTGEGRGDLRESKRTAYMWPHINLEDLLKPKCLLLFLNSRSHNQPAAFASSDLKACHLGLVTSAIIPVYLSCHVMMFTGRHTPASYGELIAWDDNPDAYGWLTSGRGVLPGEGLLVLEIQNRLYEFLVECCKGILHDKSDFELEDTTMSVRSVPSPLSNIDSGVVSLAATAAESPYRVPINLDFDRLESILTAKLAVAEDHLWALREDPSYYVASVLAARDHRPECLLDSKGQKHRSVRDPLIASMMWERVMESVVSSALLQIEVWNSILGQVVGLRVLKEKYAANISPSKDLPEEYALAFYKLRNHLDKFVVFPIFNLENGFLASPPMRPFCERMPQDPTTTMMRVTLKRGLARDKTREEILWIFEAMFDEQQLNHVDLNILMDELDRLMESNSKAKELISPWVADQISDLSLISQCIHQIQLYQPWADSFLFEILEREDEMDQDYLPIKKVITPIRNIRFRHNVTSLCRPSGERFYYPVDKRKTRKNIESMIHAEQNLDRLWQVIDQELASQNAISTHFQELLSKRQLQRTSEWSEPAEVTHKPVEPQLPSAQPLWLNSSIESASKKLDVLVTKSKLKTRGTEHPPPADVSLDARLVEQLHINSQPTFYLDKRAHKVFKTIFFTTSASSQPGEVAWADFLYAMSSTGFLIEKLYGSVWQFTPTKPDLERAILFHEPHPSGKIPFMTARRFGRRLLRAYGWDGSMFVVG